MSSELAWVIVGAGRVGRALILLARELGVPVRATYNQSAASAQVTRALAAPTTLVCSANIEELRAALGTPALVWLTVSDGALGEVASRIAPMVHPDSALLHTCGSLSSEILKDAGIQASCASLHPLLAVADPYEALAAMGRCHWTLEGEVAASAAARGVLRKLGVEPHEISAQAKALYHASAVSVAGLLVSLVDAGLLMATHAGFSPQQARELLLPLAQSSLDNLAKMPAEQALTGPAARGDEQTIRRHREALGGAPELLEIYDVLSAHAARLKARRDG